MKIKKFWNDGEIMGDLVQTIFSEYEQYSIIPENDKAETSIWNLKVANINCDDLIKIEKKMLQKELELFSDLLKNLDMY